MAASPRALLCLKLTRFLGIAVLVFLVLGPAMSWFGGSSAGLWCQEALATCSARVGSLLGMRASVFGIHVATPQRVLVQSQECVGYGEFRIACCLIVAARCRVGFTVMWLLTVASMIAVINVARIVVLVSLSQTAGQPFVLAHDYWWPVVNVACFLCACGVFAWSARRVDALRRVRCGV